jgi:hypothetical protein
MRRAVILSVLAAGLAAGCSTGDGGPVGAAVTTPPASATAATSPAAGGAAPAATGTAAPPASGSAPPPVEDPGGTAAAGPAAAYAALVREWRSARAGFVTAVSAGRPPSAREQNALAARFLAAQRRFDTALRSYDWPGPARPAVRRLRAENGVQQRFIRGMTEAGTPAEFTARLAAYGVGAAREDAAVAAVTAALD